jgi:hypothetical protein
MDSAPMNQNFDKPPTILHRNRKGVARLVFKPKSESHRQNGGGGTVGLLQPKKTTGGASDKPSRGRALMDM